MIEIASAAGQTDRKKVCIYIYSYILFCFFQVLWGIYLGDPGHILSFINNLKLFSDLSLILDFFLLNFFFGLKITEEIFAVRSQNSILLH